MPAVLTRDLRAVRNPGRHPEPPREPRPVPRGYLTTTTVVERTGLSYRQLNYLLTMYPHLFDLDDDDSQPGSGFAVMIPALMVPRLHVLAGLRERGLAWRNLARMSHQQRLRLLGLHRRAERG